MSTPRRKIRGLCSTNNFALSFLYLPNESYFDDYIRYFFFYFHLPPTGRLGNNPAAKSVQPDPGLRAPPKRPRLLLILLLPPFRRDPHLLPLPIDHLQISNVPLFPFLQLRSLQSLSCNQQLPPKTNDIAVGECDSWWVLYWGGSD